MMARVRKGAPFGERGSRLGGVIDLATGRYPGFVFGLPVGRLLPVFHFHQSTVASVEPALQYLAENGYRTVQADEVARLVRDGRHPGPRSVMLCFDDALASLWLVVAPLLARYGLRAVTYAIPGRIAEATSVRPTIEDGLMDAAAADAAPNPFATWPELRALSDGGVVEVQSHTQTHSMVFVSERDRLRGIIGIAHLGRERREKDNRETARWRLPPQDRPEGSNRRGNLAHLHAAHAGRVGLPRDEESAC